MKNIICVISLGFMVLTTTAYGQLSKKEIKEWKKTKKAMGPEEFKNMIEENASLKERVNDMTGQVASIQNDLDQKRTEVVQLEGKLTDLESSLAEARTMDVSGEATDNTTKVARGVVFKVQIGAFKNKDLAKYFGTSENFGGEVDSDGTQRYTLGNFKDYWQADKFKKYLREMGVKDAWIVPYKDGRRVPMKDVLEGVI